VRDVLAALAVFACGTVLAVLLLSLFS